MARSDVRAFDRGAPDWLRRIVDDPLKLPFGRRLAKALGLRPNGEGAAIALQVAAHVFEVHATHAELDMLANWADLASSMAFNARLATDFPRLLLDANAQEGERSWSALARLSKARFDALEVGVCVSLSLALLEAIRAKEGLPEALLPRVSSMAYAHGTEVRRASREAWTLLAQLVSSPLNQETLDRLAEFAAGKQLDDARALASHLHAAQTSLRKVPDPGTDSLVDDVEGDDGRQDGLLSEAGTVMAMVLAPGPSQPRADVTPRASCLPPSVRSLPKAASFATMAELFAIQSAWNRQPPQRLKAVTAAAQLTLVGETVATNFEASLLGVMALVISHDFNPTLELSLENNGDLWYSRQKRCVLAHRRLLLKLDDNQPGPTWYPLYTPSAAADAIESLWTAKPQARRFKDLFDPATLYDLVSQAEAWIKSLSDPAHPAWSARMAHSLGLVYLACGASPLEAGLQSLNTSLAPASAANYYQPNPARQHELASRVFQFLGLGTPGPIVYPEPDDLPAAPDDEEVRAEWRHYCSNANAAFGEIGIASTQDAVVNALNKGMAAGRRAFKLLTGGRAQQRTQPTLRDVCASDQWLRLDDKRTKPSSERLIPLTPAVREVIRVVWALRIAARDRLRALGVEDAAIPVLLIDPRPSSMLFLRLRTMDRRGRQILATGPLDADAMALVPQLWRGPQNMGRRFWVTQAACSPQWWAELVITGHGRGLAHVGSPCLSLPIHCLLEGTRELCDTVLSRLSLGAFGDAIPGEYPEVAVGVDLRHIDRRRNLNSRASDQPRHHCDSHTLPAIRVIDALREHTGTSELLSPWARALLSLVVVDGLVHSADVRAAWECLRAVPVDPLEAGRTAMLRFTRDSGQPICMPVQPPTRLARDEAQKWPPFEAVEAELAAWLAAVCIDVQWPQKPSATIVSLCWLASRWVCLYIPPFLLEAYRHETMASTLDEASLLALFGAAPTEVALTETQLRKLCRLRSHCPAGKTELQWLLKRIGRVCRPDDDIGGRQRRANLVRRMAPRVFNAFALSPAAAMAYCWLLLECDLTYDRDGNALAPSTYYEYLSRVRWVLEAHWPEGRRASELSAEEWLQLTVAMRQVRDGESAENVELRLIAWRRIVSTLAGNADHRGASAALIDMGGAVSVTTYRPSAASALVLEAQLPRARDHAEALFGDQSLERLQALAQLALLVEGANRRGELCATKPSDVALDGTFVAFIGNGLEPGKTWWARRITFVSADSAELLVELRRYCQNLSVPPKFLFAESEGVVSKRLALERYRQLVDLLRAVYGNQAIEGHSCRGSAAMRMLAGNWETLFRQFVNGPLELKHAQALLQSLIGDGPAHLAEVLTRIGHASHKSFVKHYCSAWPLWYAAAMRATQKTLRLRSSLIRHMPAIAEAKTKADEKAAHIEKALDAHRAFIYATPANQPKDSWAWALMRAHWPGWKRDPGSKNDAKATKRPRPAAVPPPAAARPKPPQRSLLFRYLLLRRLGHLPEAALETAKIGRAGSELAEAMLSVLPTLAEARGHERRKAKPAKPLLDFARTVVDHTDGRALLAGIRSASPLAASTLREMLTPRTSAKEVTAPRILVCRDLLPAQLRIEVGISKAHWADGLADALNGQARVRCKRLAKWESSRPRVRLLPAQNKGHIDHYRASALTLIAQMALAIWQQLPQEIET